MTSHAMVTIHSVDDDGIGSETQTYIAKLGEELKVANPLKTIISAIVVDRIEENLAVHNLDEFLKELDLEFLPGVPVNLTESMISQIKQVFASAGYVHSGIREQADKLLQDMTNLHANMEQDYIRLAMIPTPIKYTADFSNGRLSSLMTGKEWYIRFEAQLSLDTMPQERSTDRYYGILKSAKRAVGIE